MFSLEFIADPSPENGELCQRGRIMLDDFSEEFLSPIVFWTAADYRRHWHEAAERLLNGAERSCFVTAMYASPADGVIFMWPAYRRGEDIFLQHRLLLAEHVVGDFDSLNPYAQVDAHETKSADGEVLSEWHVRLQDVARFVDAT